jgi:hypothetical protein
MGRSGTSLLCQILSRLGVYFGEPDELIKANALNERGFYEHAAINDTLESALKANDADWLTDQPIPSAWFTSESAHVARKAIAGHLVDVSRPTNSNQGQILGFKNPRATLLLPLMDSVFRALNLDPVYLRCLRDPHEVHASINRIQSPRTRAFTLRETLAVWANYYTASHTVDAFDVWYEDWFSDATPRQLQRLLNQLDVRTRVKFDRILDVIDPELRHP